MERSFSQVTSLCRKLDVPLVIAGDLFDKWNPPPQLIEFVAAQLIQLEHVYAIPGQHDLPNHNYELMHKSGYGVLRTAGIITDMHPGVPYKIGDFSFIGFPWGYEITKPHKGSGMPMVAIAHRYIWTEGHTYVGADPRLSVTQSSILKHYTASFFGDNHKGFLWIRGKCSVLNCGGFMRRKSDEKSYQPSVGLLYTDGTVKRHPILTTEDVFHRNPELDKIVPEIDMDEFISEMNRLGDVAINFPEQILRYIDEHSLEPNVKEALQHLLLPF